MKFPDNYLVTKTGYLDVLMKNLRLKVSDSNPLFRFCIYPHGFSRINLFCWAHFYSDEEYEKYVSLRIEKQLSYIQALTFREKRKMKKQASIHTMVIGNLSGRRVLNDIQGGVSIFYNYLSIFINFITKVSNT